jgi:DNA repair protein RecN (Recombination protein N)
MLTQLSIRNFALIASADIAFSTGFTSITGETGSGKSILLGALNLILGERADYSVIRDTDKKTVVEAVFQIADLHKEWFESQDIDWETETVIRREITAQGKSRAFINDTPVQLTQLKELTEQLIYIHSQQTGIRLHSFSVGGIGRTRLRTKRLYGLRAGISALWSVG